MPTIYINDDDDLRHCLDEDRWNEKELVATARFSLLSHPTNKILHECKTPCDRGFMVMTLIFIVAGTWRAPPYRGEKEKVATVDVRSKQGSMWSFRF